MAEKNKSDKKNSAQINKLLFKGEIQELCGKNKWKNLFAQIDSSSIVFFRIIFGLLMLIDVILYYDKINLYWIAPKYHFYYWPFDFLSPLPGNGMYLLFILMGILSVLIIVGLFYRISMILFFLSFSYMFLLEQTRYLNHFYLIIIASFIMIFIPANTSLSLDNKIFKNNKSDTGPAWTLWLLRFIITLPYFFGGIAKLNYDWIHGEPLRMWLTKNAPAFTFGSLFQHEGVILFMVYSGLILDLFIIPLLLFKKTRTIGFVIITLFHLLNSQLFRIDIFPWFMIAATTLFFNPDWFRNFINFFSRKKNSWPISFISKEKLIYPNELLSKHKKIIALLSIFVILQLIIPLRHFLIPGNAIWTEEGQKFSWQMKLRTKSEIASYLIKDKVTGKVYDINIYNYIRPWQKKIMEDKPNLVWQFCQIVKNDFKKRGIEIAFYANIKASLNGRKYQPLIDSTVDLASVPYNTFSHSNWIVDLNTPLNERLNEIPETNKSSSPE